MFLPNNPAMDRGMTRDAYPVPRYRTRSNAMRHMNPKSAFKLDTQDMRHETFSWVFHTAARWSELYGR